jgi:aminoglycoside phosphotransferase (APT) family kinase protein
MELLMAIEIPELLDVINARQGTSFRLVGQLPGGTRGAWEVIGPDGVRAVLKRGRSAFEWASRARRAARVSEEMRAVGYPTARYLLVGETPDGTAYQVHELLPGAAPTELTDDVLVAILALVELQAGRGTPPEQDWSEYARSVVFAGREGWADVLRDHSPETGALLDALNRAVAPHRDARLGNEDVVHGDCSAQHVLMVDGRVTGVVDFDQVGCGTRALDLAMLLGWHHDEMDERSRDRLDGRIMEVAGSAGAAVCLAYQVLNEVAYVAQHYPSGLEQALRVGWALLRRIESRP